MANYFRFALSNISSSKRQASITPRDNPSSISHDQDQNRTEKTH